MALRHKTQSTDANEFNSADGPQERPQDALPSEAKNSITNDSQSPLSGQDASDTSMTSSGTAAAKKDKKTKDASSLTKRQEVEHYLKAEYEFHFNELTGGVEFAKENGSNFLELTDYRLNSLCREIDSKLCVNILSSTLLGYLKSDFVQTYHPFKEYFKSLPEQNGLTAIGELAATVEVEKPDCFQTVLTHWLVASVANAFESKNCQNQTCLVLTGAQGTFKTSWLNLLCPIALNKYLFCGKIDLKSKDTLILLATKFIVNLDDQLRELNKNDEETVKTLITHVDVTVRRPYDKIESYLTRVASFCASVNSNDFLSDPTGSRRFLPFEVQKIDLKRAQEIDIDKVWAEAYKLYTTGFKYWFTTDELTKLFDGNKEFQVLTAEYEVLHEYYDVVRNESNATDYLTSSMLLRNLQEFSQLKLSSQKLGKALNKSKAIKKTMRNAGNVKVWFLRKRSQKEREDLNNLAEN